MKFFGAISLVLLLARITEGSVSDPYVISGIDTYERRSEQEESRRHLQDGHRRKLEVLSSVNPLKSFWEVWKMRDESKTNKAVWSDDLTLVKMKVCSFIASRSLEKGRT